MSDLQGSENRKPYIPHSTVYYGVDQPIPDAVFMVMSRPYQKSIIKHANTLSRSCGMSIMRNYACA